jgi:lipopolysaccharide/colanic/teichoic acid biosynthesis glycosyltransferase
MSSGPYSASKRLIDVVGSVVALAIASPLILVVTAAIRLHDSGPVFFRQARSGKDGIPFHVIKFRTMSGADSGSDLPDLSSWVTGVPDDFVFKTSNSKVSRVTPIGRWLRRSSLDELPQFLNVLRGEMSVVGPRPEILQITERYSPEQARRLSVKPGITGWAQVTGRSMHNHGQKIEADLYYVDNASTRLDLWILLRTVRVALHGREAY